MGRPSDQSERLRTAQELSDDGGPVSRLAAWTGRTLVMFGPLLVLATLLSGAGMVVGMTVGYESAFSNARWFFKLVLAGALMAVLRNEVGLSTYGLFGPVVIAFIMIGAGPVWGLVLFLNVLAVTLFSYRALGRLKLGTAPRVAVLLSVAAIGMALTGAASVAGKLPAVYGSGQVFFPVIISAWYADRAASDIEERGWTEPAKRLLGTLVAIVLSYALITTDAILDWFVTTPPAWGVTLVAIAYLGSRPGFRVSEYLRFDDHFEGKLGPVSVASARFEYRLRRLRHWVAGALGREVAVDRVESDAAVLSMKRRNRYIEEYNPPHLRPAADDKATITRRLTGLGVDSPETYAVLDTPGTFAAARRVIRSRSAFVIKPSQGHGGEGIVVVSDRDGEQYETSKGPKTTAELLDHVRRILDGHYSDLDVGGTAIVEEKLAPAEGIRDLHGTGVADIRVLIFQGYPVMAMTRLPTEASGGAANLHLGAVGVGVSIVDGTPLGAFQQSRNREVTVHPDTGASLTDFQVPNWEAVLRTAMEAAAASGLGYTGVDVVLTEGNEPKVLEVNVRPGLGIQNTTGAGIFERLAFIESLPPECEFLPPARKLELAREWEAAEYVTDARPDGQEFLREESAPGPTAIDEPTGQAVDQADASTSAGEGSEGLEHDETRPVARSGSILVRTGGVVVTGLLLFGVWAAGFPLLVGLFVCNACGFVVGLCIQASDIGTQSDPAARP